MAYPIVQNVQSTRIRTNIDGSTLPERRKAYALYAQGASAPVPQASGVYTAGQTCVSVFDGNTESVFFCDTNAKFTFFKNFTPPESFGSRDPGGDEYEILFVDVPSAANYAGLCLANP